MSEEITPTELKDQLILTSFWGGVERGPSIQITLNQQNSKGDSGDYVQLDQHQVFALAGTLMKWHIARELEKHKR